MKKALRTLGLTVILCGVAAGALFTTGGLKSMYAAPNAGMNLIPLCSNAAPGTAHCHAIEAVPAAAQNQVLPKAATPTGYTPADLQSAYQLPSANAGQGQTIAIVDAFDDPVAESDLKVYRSQFGLPECSTANGCFKKVDQNGGTNYPKGDLGWGGEIALDLDMASAVCPNCKILLVEANSANFNDMAAAVDTAAKLGANAISNSYGGGESAGTAALAAHYNHPGIAITASTGDNGFGVELPAAFSTVTAVGGTTLNHAGNARGWDETAWSGAGSGCSTTVAKPAWQKDAGCANRALADVSAVADPNTGVAVYYSLQVNNASGWISVGGTSASAPIIAGVYALAGNAGSINDASLAYAHPDALNDVTSGSNGNCGSYLCTAGPGYDGPTGLGTPKGTGAF